MKYKLLALDFDGTLLPYGAPDGVSPRLLKALLAAKRAGVTLCAATGRSLVEAAPMLHSMPDVFDYAVTTNGAQVYRFPHELLAAHTFTASATEAVMNVLRRYPGLFLQAFLGGEPYCEEHILQSEHLAELLRGYENMMGKPLSSTPDFAALFAEKELPCMLFVITPSDDVAREIAQAVEALGIADITCSTSYNVEIMPKGVGKVSGIETVCRALGIFPEEVMAIGDSGNDRAMLAYAGLGVAMGNAPEDMRREADAVTATVDEDGAALAIERYVLGGEQP